MGMTESGVEKAEAGRQGRPVGELSPCSAISLEYAGVRYKDWACLCDPKNPKAGMAVTKPTRTSSAPPTNMHNFAFCEGCFAQTTRASKRPPNTNKTRLEIMPAGLTPSPLQFNGSWPLPGNVEANIV